MVLIWRNATWKMDIKASKHLLKGVGCEHKNMLSITTKQGNASKNTIPFTLPPLKLST